MNKLTKKEKTIAIVGYICFAIQFILFVIAKNTVKNSYSEEVIGTIRIGNMVGADTVTHQSVNTSSLGVFCVIMLFVFFITFIVLGVLSYKEEYEHGFYRHMIFAFITVAGLILATVF